MVQEVFFFTEKAYSGYPHDVAAQRGYTALMLPNAYFDPAKAHDFIVTTWTTPGPFHQVITGTPDSIIPKLQKVIDVVNPAWLVLWAREGLMSHAAAMRSIELLGKEVIPAIKGYQPSSDGQQGARENNS